MRWPVFPGADGMANVGGGEYERRRNQEELCDGRSEARAKSAEMDGGPCEPLSFERWGRRAHVYDEPTGSACADGAVAAADDGRAQVRGEIRVPVVLRP